MLLKFWADSNIKQNRKIGMSTKLQYFFNNPIAEMSSIKKFLLMFKGYLLMHSISPNNHQTTLLLIFRKIRHVVLVVLSWVFEQENTCQSINIHEKQQKKIIKTVPQSICT